MTHLSVSTILNSIYERNRTISIAFIVLRFEWLFDQWPKTAFAFGWLNDMQNVQHFHYIVSLFCRFTLCQTFYSALYSIYFHDFHFLFDHFFGISFVQAVVMVVLQWKLNSIYVEDVLLLSVLSVRHKVS